MVGGYSAAWVGESRNFAHYSWQKRFMDIAGENMDFGRIIFMTRECDGNARLHRFEF